MPNVDDRHDTSRSRKRTRGLSKGSEINFYKDLGLSTTEAGYKAWREEEDAFQEAVAHERAMLAKRGSELSKARREYEKAYGSLPTVASMVGEAWNKNKDNMTNVIVASGNVEKRPSKELVAAAKKEGVSLRGVHGFGGANADDPVRDLVSKYRIQNPFDEVVAYKQKGSYLLPKEGAQALHNNNKLRTKFVDGNLVVFDRRGGKDIRGLLNSEFDKYSTKYRSDFNRAAGSKAASVLGQANSNFSSYGKELANAEADYNAAKNSLESKVTERARKLNVLRSDYRARIDKARKVILGLK